MPEISSIDKQIIAEYPKLSPKETANNYAQVMNIDLSKPLTDQSRKVLEQYEGRGNQYDTGQIDEGLVHQFYTPYIITKKAWDLAKHYGFTEGNVCEPSCGTGRFFKYAPNNTNLYGFDLDETNVKITKALYPGATIYHQEFETAFLQNHTFSKAIKKSWLPEMDLVIGNPPYGNYEGYYKTYMPKLYGRFEFLFIRKGLELLKSGGLLIYIVSQNVMNNGGKYDKMKENILEIGEFVDAFRMPVGIFSGTQIGTDIVIFKRK